MQAIKTIISVETNIIVSYMDAIRDHLPNPLSNIKSLNKENHQTFVHKGCSHMFLPIMQIETVN